MGARPSCAQAKVDQVTTTDKELRVTQEDLEAMKVEVALKTKELEDRDREDTSLDPLKVCCRCASPIYAVRRIFWLTISVPLSLKSSHPMNLLWGSIRGNWTVPICWSANCQQ